MMDAWFDMFRLPLSGDVSQTMDPRVFSPNVTVDFAGNAAVEGAIVANVASYGRQLDVLIGAVLMLGRTAGVDMAELSKLSAEIEAEKARQVGALRGAAEQALEHLRHHDPDGYAALISGLK